MLRRIRGLLRWPRAAIAAAAPSDELRRQPRGRARSRNARYEVALTLDAIARVAEAGGRLDAPARAEADELFAALGVVFVPDRATRSVGCHGGGLSQRLRFSGARRGRRSPRRGSARPARHPSDWGGRAGR